MKISCKIQLKIMITTPPIYPYNQLYLPDTNDGALFHYTSAASFFKILESMSLKLSSFKKLNDLNEVNIKALYFSDKDNKFKEKLKNYINKECNLLCFTQNYKCDKTTEEGTNHPAMWAHYADNNKGVCIVLDEKEFLAKNKDILKKSFHKLRKVKYARTNVVLQKFNTCSTSTPESFIRQNYKELFFLKHSDWITEREKRLFVICKEKYLSIEGCIKYIALGEKFLQDKKCMNKLMEIITSPKNNLCPESFVSCEENINGYLAFPIGSMIRDLIEHRKYNDKH